MSCLFMYTHTGHMLFIGLCAISLQTNVLLRNCVLVSSGRTLSNYSISGLGAGRNVENLLVLEGRRLFFRLYIQSPSFLLHS